MTFKIHNRIDYFGCNHRQDLNRLPSRGSCWDGLVLAENLNFRAQKLALNSILLNSGLEEGS